MLITTELALAHCNADVEDTVLMTFYSQAAEQEAVDYINRNVFADQSSLDAAVLAGLAGAAPLVATKAILQAILLIIGHRFANREDVVVGTGAIELPMGSRSLLAPYRYGMGA